jgi:hypothetical protein
MRLFFLAVCILVTSTAGVGAETGEVSYYAIMAEGKKIGHAVETRQVENGIVTTVAEQTMTMHRFGTAVKIYSFEKHVETVEGKPLAFETVSDMSGMSSKVSGKITSDGKLKLKTEQMGSVTGRTIDYPEGALLSEGMRLLEIEKGLKPGTTYETTIFLASLMTTARQKVVVGKKQQIDLFGRVVNATAVEVTISTPLGAIVSTSYVDDNHQGLKTVMSAVGINLEIVACDKQFALSENSVVDFLDKLLLESPVKIDKEKSRKSAMYTLLPDKDAKLSIASGDSQTVKKLADGRVTVEVKPVAMTKGVKFPYKGKDPEILKALESTQHVQGDNQNVIKLARDAVGDSKDAADAVRKIESFVAGYINERNLSVGYASAAEVAVSRQGDCTEHAVLTAAMCRAVGIPAQVVFGIVYVDNFAGRKNVFGGHAWTQAYIGDKWICIDATKAPDGYGVGHIIFAAGNGDPAEFFGIANTLGYFKIEKVVLK